MTEESYTNLKKLVVKGIVILAASVICGIGLNSFAEWYKKPQQAYFWGDLNEDHVFDLVIEQQNGHKVPMYGVKKEDSIDDQIIYLSASEMMQRNSSSIIKIDYETIEARLNK